MPRYSSECAHLSPTDSVRAFVLAVILLSLFVSIPSQWAFAEEPEASKAPQEFITAIEWIAERTIPAVVHIEVTERQEMVSPDEYGKYGLKRQQGVAVVGIEPNGPLGNAGFEIEDVILAINGRAIEDVEEFVRLLSAIQPGQRIVLLALDHRGKTGYAQVVAR